MPPQTCCENRTQRPTIIKHCKMVDIISLWPSVIFLSSWLCCPPKHAVKIWRKGPQSWSSQASSSSSMLTSLAKWSSSLLMWLFRIILHIYQHNPLTLIKYPWYTCLFNSPIYLFHVTYLHFIIDCMYFIVSFIKCNLFECRLDIFPFFCFCKIYILGIFRSI